MDWVWLAIATVLAAGVAALVVSGLRRPALQLDGFVPAEAPTPADRLLAALQRTRDAVGESLAGIFRRERADETTLEALEEALLRADVGARGSAALIAELRLRVPRDAPASALQGALRSLIEERLSRLPTALAVVESGPLVILVVGVNGSGKTTTIGKLAARFRSQGKTVMLGAGDTFRAGAVEQLKIWGERAGVPVVSHQEGADPAAVLHDTVQSAVAKKVDVVIADTAGRLQSQRTLMDELAKIRRVIGKIAPGAPHETLLVLDGTMGQNAIAQARVFREVAGVTGVVLTKLDGTARGGVVIAIAEEFDLPVKLVGIGEKVEDLRPFDPATFAAGLFPAAEPARAG